MINKSTMRWTEMKSSSMASGRAMVIKIPWFEEKTVKILNVYAPNNQVQNQLFWKII